ncbi:hypothetical protein CMMCAS03_01600 [Clavibacter michiganensis subsp. michiganensis]|nr:hypothetical protein CMMCAS03_01600 [Clavibacter michiganensis subsp. michiganensis]
MAGAEERLGDVRHGHRLPGGTHEREAVRQPLAVDRERLVGRQVGGVRGDADRERRAASGLEHLAQLRRGLGVEVTELGVGPAALDDLLAHHVTGHHVDRVVRAHHDAVVPGVGRAGEDLRGELRQHRRERDALPERLRRVAARVGAVLPGPRVAAGLVAVLEALGEADVGARVGVVVLGRARRPAASDEAVLLVEERRRLRQLPGVARGLVDRAEAGTQAVGHRHGHVGVLVDDRAVRLRLRSGLVDLHGHVVVELHDVRPAALQRRERVEHGDEVVGRVRRVDVVDRGLVEGRGRGRRLRRGRAGAREHDRQDRGGGEERGDAGARADGRDDGDDGAFRGIVGRSASRTVGRGRGRTASAG